MSAPNGGPAFPVSYGPDGAPGYADGMTLRDYFAGQALAGIASRIAVYDDGPDVEWIDVAVLHAYAYADAMLAERSK